MCNRRANWLRRKAEAALKIQSSQIANFGRLTDREDDRKSPDYEAAPEGEYKQQPNREVRQLGYAFADDVTATDYVGNSASKKCEAEHNHCTQPLRLAPHCGQVGHNPVGEPVVVNVWRRFAQLPV